MKPHLRRTPINTPYFDPLYGTPRPRFHNMPPGRARRAAIIDWLCWPPGTNHIGIHCEGGLALKDPDVRWLLRRRMAKMIRTGSSGRINNVRRTYLVAA